MTTVCFVLRTVIMVQKENLARTEKRYISSNAQAAVARPASSFYGVLVNWVGETETFARLVQLGL